MPEHDKTARRAYAIWEEEGRPEGRDREHWAQAEAETQEEDPGFAEEAAGWTGAEGQGGAVAPGGEDTLGAGSLEAGADPAGADRLPGEAEGETEAPLQDGDGAGRPGRGPYAGP